VVVPAVRGPTVAGAYGRLVDESFLMGDSWPGWP
jgi:hypothetical protein